MEKENKSHTELILDYLQKGGTLTKLDALRMFRCLSLASRIHDLKKLGYKINSELLKTTGGKYVSHYSMGGIK